MGDDKEKSEKSENVILETEDNEKENISLDNDPKDGMTIDPEIIEFNTTASNQYKKHISSKDANKEEEEEEVFYDETAYKERILRLQADFDNFRKRTAKEKLMLRQYGSENLICDLLGVIDNFTRALESSQSDQDVANIVTGVEMIQKQLLQILENKGLQHMNVKGEQFNPHEHEALSFENTDQKNEDQLILEELQSGYKLYDKIIRVAKVKIAKYSGD